MRTPGAFYVIMIFTQISSLHGDDDCTSVDALDDASIFYSHEGFPNQQYGHDIESCWIITGEEGRTVEMNVTQFDLEDAAGYCRYDFLEIIRGSSSAGEYIAQYCGTVGPETLHSYVDEGFYLAFQTDGSVAAGGFAVSYKLADASLAPNITGPSTTTRPDDDSDDPGASIFKLQYLAIAFFALFGFVAVIAYTVKRKTGQSLRHFLFGGPTIGNRQVTANQTPEGLRPTPTVFTSPSPQGTPDSAISSSVTTHPPHPVVTSPAFTTHHHTQMTPVSHVAAPGPHPPPLVPPGYPPPVPPGSHYPPTPHTQQQHAVTFSPSVAPRSNNEQSYGNLRPNRPSGTFCAIL